MEGDLAAVEAYKSSGGDIARQLTADEVQLLNRSSAFDVGFTLVHLAIRFQRQDMLAILLTEVSKVNLCIISYIVLCILQLLFVAFWNQLKSSYNCSASLLLTTLMSAC